MLNSLKLITLSLPGNAFIGWIVASLSNEHPFDVKPVLDLIRWQIEKPAHQFSPTHLVSLMQLIQKVLLMHLITVLYHFYYIDDWGCQHSAPSGIPSCCSRSKVLYPSSGFLLKQAAPVWSDKGLSRCDAIEERASPSNGLQVCILTFWWCRF